MIYEILIPLPPAGVTAHNTGHWRSKSDKIKKYRKDCCLAALGEARDGAIRYRVKIDHEWYLGKSRAEKAGARSMFYRPRDIANAIQALKPAIDGLVDAGLLFDDTHEYVAWGEYTREKGLLRDVNPGVLLKIEVLLDQPVKPKVRKEKRP